MIPVEQLSHPVVRPLVQALNAGDRDAFFSLLTDDATMSDDGSERDPGEWTGREVFGVNGHMDVVWQADDGLSLIADYRNDTWGSMRTTWTFTVADDRVSRFETGQA